MKKFFSILILILFIPTMSVAASTFFLDENLVLDEATSGNVFTLGQNIEINEPINGNLYAIGNRININANVSGYVFLVGSEINVEGNIGSTFHAASAVLNLNSTISGDVYAATSLLQTSNRTLVGGEMYLAGDSVSLEGRYENDVNIASSFSELSGTFSENLNIVSGRKTNIESTTVVLKDLDLKSPNQPDNLDEVVRGEFNYTALTLENRTSNFIRSTFTSAFSLSILLVSLILSILVPNLFTSFAEIKFESLGKNIFIGLLAFIFWIFLTLLFLVPIVIGWPISLFLVIVLTLSYVIFYPLVGFSLVVYLLRPKKISSFKTFLFAVVGSILLLLISAIPYVGPIVILILFLSFLGTMYKWKTEVWSKLKRAGMI